MRTRIISAFPGTGKSTYAKNNPSTSLDLDSSSFSWLEPGVRNPEFPNNYIAAIKENIGKYEFIFVSSHKDVRNALRDNCLFFYLVYPNNWSYEVRQAYMQRYRDRGNDDNFIALIEKNWHPWLSECENFKIGCRNFCLYGDFLADDMDYLLQSEIGR